MKKLYLFLIVILFTGTAFAEVKVDYKDPNLFATEYLSLLRTYTPDTIRNNVTKAMKYSTSAVVQALSVYFDADMLNAIKRDNVTQTLSLDADIKRTPIIRDNFAMLFTGAITRTTGEKTTKQKFTYILNITVGKKTDDNPYGWYVNTFMETLLE